MASKFIPAANLYRVLQMIANEIDRDLPITIPLAFLAVAAAGDEGLDQGRLQEELKASSSGISRTIQTLSDHHYGKEKAGLGLVERAFDPTDNRRRLLRLTTKGNKLIEKLAAEMQKAGTK